MEVKLQDSRSHYLDLPYILADLAVISGYGKKVWGA